MDSKESALINLMQEGIPLVSRPFKALGEVLNMTEEETLETFKGLKEKGLIRRFGGIVNISKLDIVSTLVGLKVDEKNIETVAVKVNQLNGVTHNYQRDDAYNLWFTLMESNQNDLEEHLHTIRTMEEVESLINLPSKKKYKTKVMLQL
jgi:DNA-binding Lrp family transcriptional regulator